MLQSQTQTCLSFEAERGEKKGGGGAEGANFKPKAVSFLFFPFFVFYELTLADVWLYHSQSNSQHHVQLCRASLPCSSPSSCTQAFRQEHLGGGCREFRVEECWENSSFARRLWASPRVCPEGSLRAANAASFAQGWVSLYCPVPANLPWAKGATGFLLAFNSGDCEGWRVAEGPYEAEWMGNKMTDEIQWI